jgi:hypothetical protein
MNSAGNFRYSSQISASRRVPSDRVYRFHIANPFARRCKALGAFVFVVCKSRGATMPCHHALRQLGPGMLLIFALV